MLTMKALRSPATMPTTTSPTAIGRRIGRSSVLRQASDSPDGAEAATGMIGVPSRAGSRLDAHAITCRTAVSPSAPRPPNPRPLDPPAAAVTWKHVMDRLYQRTPDESKSPASRHPLISNQVYRFAERG